MTDQQLHHVLNHLPSIGIAIGFFALLVGMFLRKKGTALTGAWIILLAAITVLPADQTGEEAEETVEDIAGVNHDQIHEHEEAAERAIPFTIAAGILALAYLLSSWKRPAWSNYLGIATGIAAAVAIYLLIVTSHEGGLIRHPELGTTQVAAPAAGGEGDDDD